MLPSSPAICRLSVHTTSMNSWKAAAHKKNTVLPLFPTRVSYNKTNIQKSYVWWNKMGIFTFNLFPTDFSPLYYAGTHLCHAPLWLQIEAASKTIPRLHHTNKKKDFHSQRPYHHIALLVFSNPNLQIATFSLIPLSPRNPPSALPGNDKCPANQHTHKKNIPFIFTKINDCRSTRWALASYLYFSSLFALPANCVHRAREVDWFWAHTLFCTELKRRPTTDPRPSCPQTLA